MNRPMYLICCCLLATTAFAEPQKGGRTGGIVAGPHNGGGHVHGAIRGFGYGRNGYGYGGYGYGGYYGGYFDPFYDQNGFYPFTQPAEAGAPTPLIYPSTAQPAMVAPVHSVIHEYTHAQDYGTGGMPDKSPVLYLIAFRDKNIRAAMTYWIQDGTLHYLDTDHKEQHAPLTAVDREMSAQLNRERHIPFTIE